MFCMNCVLCINISRPEAKTYEYITYWLISSRIANCFKLTATLSYLYEMWWCWEAFFWERISSVSSTTWEFEFQLKRNWKEIEKKLPVFFHSNQERTLAADQVGRRRAKRDANRRKTWRSSRWDWTEETNYDSFSDVGEIRVYRRADFQSGSRVKLVTFMDWFYVCLKISFPSCFEFTLWTYKLQTFDLHALILCVSEGVLSQ